MRELILWISSFFALLISLFWIQVMYSREEKSSGAKNFPKITVLIPAYNEEKTISKTINSVLNLNYPKDKLEIIVIDDSSKDKTGEVVKGFKQVKLVYNKHKGVGKASALNAGLRYSSGEFLAVVDADSEVEKDSLIKLIPYFG